MVAAPSLSISSFHPLRPIPHTRWWSKHLRLEGVSVITPEPNMVRALETGRTAIQRFRLDYCLEPGLWQSYPPHLQLQGCILTSQVPERLQVEHGESS